MATNPGVGLGGKREFVSSGDSPFQDTPPTQETQSPEGAAAQLWQTSLRSMVKSLARNMKALSALAFATRCAIRSRPGACISRGEGDFEKSLGEYDQSLRDGVTICMQPDSQSGIQAAARIFEERVIETIDAKSGRCDEIDSIIKRYMLSGEDGGRGDESLSEQVLASIDNSWERLARAARNGGRDDIRYYLVLVKELITLAEDDAEGPLDPTESGPLKGFWPRSLGAPDWFEAFEQMQPLDLGLRTTASGGNIRSLHRKQEPITRQGGRAAESPETGMDVSGLSDETLRSPAPAPGRGKLPAEPVANREAVESPFKSLSGASLRKLDSRPVQPIGFSGEESALEFETVEERDRAIDMIWDESGPLFRLPYDVGNQTTLIVPAFAARLFVESGLGCHESPAKPQRKALAEAGISDLNREEMGARPGGPMDVELGPLRPSVCLGVRVS